MNKRANLYFAALLGAMSPLSTVTALAAQSNSAIATATQQQNSCKGTVKDASGEPIIGATIRIDGKTYTAKESVTVSGSWSEDRIYCPYPTSDVEKNPNLKR